jgi:tetratricopeptide (TPR) repeat protein
VSLLERVRQALAPDYTVEREIAAGGMGVVFLGHDPRLDRPVAIKVLRPELATEVGAQRFLREARHLAQVKHPNVVQIHRVGDRGGIYFCVMELVRGETLAERLARGPLGAGAASALGRTLLGALAAMHRHNIVHRDIKPANVILANRPVLIDFGIARADDDTALTAGGEVVGTRAYMPPEQREGVATPATDLYAFAAVLYEACTGRRWDATRALDEADWSGVPRRLGGALRRGLAVDPKDRWPNAASFRDALPDSGVPRRPLAVGAVALVAVVVALVWPKPRPQLVLVRNDFAIMPFAGAPGAVETGHRLASYLGGRLEWYPAWTLAPIPATFAWWDSTPAGGRLESARTAPRARLYVDGDIISRPQGALLRLTLRDSASRLVHLVDVPGSAADPLAWAAAGADSIVRRTFPQELDDYRVIARRSSSSPPALDEWFLGQKEFRRDQWVGAEAHYLHALDLDPDFAQASWDLALVRRWRRDESAATVLRELWDRKRDDLPAMQRLLAEAQLEPDLERRFALFAEAVRRFPRRADAWLLYANEVFSRGPLAGIPLDSGVALFDRTTQLEPYTTAIEHATLGYIRLGDAESARKELDHLASLSPPSDQDARLRRRLLAFAYDERFVGWRGRLGELYLGWRPDSALLEGVRLYARMANFFDIPNAQVFLGRTLVAHALTGGAVATGHQAQGLGLLLLGRPGAALAHLDSAADRLRTAEARLQLAQWPVLLAPLGLGAAPPARLEAARARLAALADSTGGLRAAWALAAAAGNRGDQLEAERWTARVARDSAADADARSLHLLLRALAAGQRGRSDSAVALATPLLRYDPRGLGGDPFARALLHLQLGTWLTLQGDTAAARRVWLWTDAWDVEDWPQGEAQAGEVDAAVGAVARLRRAGLALAHDEVPTGCGLLRRVRELWSRAEPGLGARTVADSLARACR